MMTVSPNHGQLAPDSSGLLRCSPQAAALPPGVAKYMAPFVVWEAAVLIIFVLSFSSLQGARDAIVANYTGRRVVTMKFRSIRVRLYCNRMVLAETPQQVSWQGAVLLEVCSAAGAAG
jgi:hypothetical protein